MSLERSKSIEASLQTLGVEPSVVVEKSSGTTIPPIPFSRKIRLIFSNITVEPIMVLYVLPSVMASLTIQNLNLEKACRVNLALNASTCDALTVRNYSGYEEHEEVAVQKLVASMNAWKNVVQSLLPSILLMFFGSWSDRNNRRKPCIILPMLGEICATIGFILCTYFFHELPMEFNGIAESVPPSLTGGWFTMFVGVYSYVSARSSVETRTLRIGAVSLFSNVSVTIGIALSGVLCKQIGFYGVFFLALVMYLIGVTYGTFAVKEVTGASVGHADEMQELNGKANKEKKDAGEVAAAVKTNETVGVRKKRNFFIDFFDLKHIMETFRVAFKPGKRNRKARICTIMILVMVIIGPLHGEMNVTYLFVRYKFKWDETDYSIFATFGFIVHIIGTVFSMAFFLNYLKLDDTVLGAISSISKILSGFFYAFAPNPTIFYLGAIVEMFNGTSFIAMRSIMSKMVPPDELGKINSLFGVAEALMPLLYGPMYSLVYKRTINILPGSFFVLGSILTLPAVFIFGWLYAEHKKDLRDEMEEKEAEESRRLTKRDEEDGLRIVNDAELNGQAS